MQVSTRTGLGRFGGAVLAVATAAALVAVSGPAYAEESAPPTPPPSTGPVESPPATESPAPSQPPAPPESPAPTQSPAAPAVTPTPAVPGAVASPAQAADLAVTLRGTTAASGTPGKIAQVVVANNGPATARDAEVRVEVTVVDLPGTGPALVVGETPEGCRASLEGLVTVYTCRLGNLRAGMSRELLVDYAPTTGPLAAAGRLSARAWSATPDALADNNLVDRVLRIAAAGSDVVLLVLDAEDLVPGSDGELFGVIGNLGSGDARDLLVTFTLPAGTTVLGTEEELGCGIAANRRMLTCDTPVLERDFAAPFTFPIRVAPDAGGPRTLAGGTAVAADAPTARSFARTPAQTRRTAARIFAAPSKAAADRISGDTDQTDDTDTFVVTTTAPTADLAVTSATVRAGGLGEVAVPYAVRNAGPSTATGVVARITAPTGTALAGTPAGCTAAAGGRELRCAVADILAPGAIVRRTVPLRITDRSVGEDGRIVVSSAAVDPATRGNSLRLDITVGGGVFGRGLGGLPVTGAQAGLIGAAGAVLLLLGGALVVVSRRRRAAAE
jgi:LPXTG-motif cell wall-anchored protein